MNARPNLRPALDKLGNVMGALSVMERAAPNEVTIAEPDYRRACQAISEDLREAYGLLTDIEDGVA